MAKEIMITILLGVLVAIPASVAAAVLGIGVPGKCDGLQGWCLVWTIGMASLMSWIVTVPVSISLSIFGARRPFILASRIFIATPPILTCIWMMIVLMGA